MRSYETPRTESDKHCDQNKANVWAGAAVVILKAKILVNSSVYRFRNKRNGRHQTLLLGWVQNRLKISRKMAGITKRVGEIGAESIHTFPETGERPRKVQALVQSLTRFSSSSLFPLNFNPLHFNHRFNWQTVYSSSSLSNLEPGTSSSSVRTVKDGSEPLAIHTFPLQPLKNWRLFVWLTTGD